MYTFPRCSRFDLAEVDHGESEIARKTTKAFKVRPRRGGVDSTPMLIPGFPSKPSTVVVLESDLDAALAHLRGLPFGITGSLPAAWGRRRRERIGEALGPRPRCDALAVVAPGVWALVRPFGVDVTGANNRDKRLQARLLIRPSPFGATRLIKLPLPGPEPGKPDSRGGGRKDAPEN